MGVCISLVGTEHKVKGALDRAPATTAEVMTFPLHYFRLVIQTRTAKIHIQFRTHLLKPLSTIVL